MALEEEFPSGIDFDFFEDVMSEIEALLKDEDVHAPNEIGYMTISEEFWVGAGAYIFMASFLVLCWIYFIVWCEGLLRYIYGLKAVVLFTISAVQLAHLINAKMQDLRVDDVLPMRFLQNKSSMGLKLFRESLHCIFMGLTLILIHEVYLCTCKLEQRKLHLSVILTKVVIAIVLIFVLCGLHELVRAIIPKTSEDPIWYRIGTMTVPFHTLLKTCLTVAVVFWGAKIVHSQLKSIHFRGENSTGNNQAGGFLIAIVFTNAVFILCNLITHLITISWLCFFLFDVHHYIPAVDDDNYVDLHESSAQGMKMINDMSISRDFCGCMEFFCMFLLNLYKTLMKKR